MSLDTQLRRRLQHALAVEDDAAGAARLIDDAQRLWNRIGKFMDIGILSSRPDVAALELSCYALQLSQRQAPIGKLGRTSIKQRAEQSAELMVSLFGDDADETLLDRTARLLHEMTHRQPIIEEARLLADALNLDDFGVTGLVSVAMQMAAHGDGVTHFADACAKRDAYGYWEARLKDGFHFDAIRKIARRRLDQARQVAAILSTELREDTP